LLTIEFSAVSAIASAATLLTAISSKYPLQWIEERKYILDENDYLNFLIRIKDYQEHPSY